MTFLNVIFNIAVFLIDLCPYKCDKQQLLSTCWSLVSLQSSLSSIFQVSDESVSLPYTDAAGSFRIFYSGRTARYEAEFGLVVEFDGFWTLSISVPSTFSGKLTGLCGDFNGDVTDDLVKQSGDAPSGTDVGKEIGDSYVVDDPENTDSA